MKALFRNILLTLVLLAASVAGAEAQTYLMNVLKPTSKAYFYPFTGTKPLPMVGAVDWHNGFVIGSSSFYGEVSFDLGGRYDKLSFVFGHEQEGLGPKVDVSSWDPGVETIMLDDQLVFDRKLNPYDLPEWVELNVKGGRKITFKTAVKQICAAFGEVALWTAGQKPRQLEHTAKAPAKRIQLMKDRDVYFRNTSMWRVCPGGRLESMRFGGKEYKYGLHADLSIALIGKTKCRAFFRLDGQYDKISFVAGVLENKSSQADASGWLTVIADGKILDEIEIRQKDMAKQYVYDVKGAKYVSFQTEDTEWSMQLGIADMYAYPPGDEPKVEEGELPIDPKLKSLSSPCKMLSNIQAYQVGGPFERSKMIYDGKSSHINFSMGGLTYNEGVIFTSSANIMHDNVVTSAAFDLGGEFDYMTFVVGHVSDSPDNWSFDDDALMIYADGELVGTVPLKATLPNMAISVPLKKCRKLELKNAGGTGILGAAYGMADITLYRGEPVENNLFPHEAPEFPDEARLISQIGAPYLHYVSSMKGLKEKLLTGATKKEYHEVNGERVYECFLLRCDEHFSFSAGPLGKKGGAAGVAGGMAAGAASIPVGCVGGATVSSVLWGAAAFLMLAAGGTAAENSFAGFNTYGQYETVTFTVACIDKGFGNNKKEFLKIGSDQKEVAEFAFCEEMEPTTFSVPINRCNQLMFWLECTDKIGMGGKYIFYDVKVSKQKTTLETPASARVSHYVETEFPWTVTPRETQWTAPSDMPQKIWQYFNKVTNVMNETDRLMESMKPKYTLHTWYLATESGQVVKAVRTYNTDQQNYSRIEYDLSTLRSEIERLNRLLEDIRAAKSAQVDAGLALTELGLKAIAGGKQVKMAGKVTSECQKKVEDMLAAKNAIYKIINYCQTHKMDIDGKKSDDRTILSPLAPGETAPAIEMLQQVKSFDM